MSKSFAAAIPSVCSFSLGCLVLAHAQLAQSPYDKLNGMLKSNEVENIISAALSSPN
jgi:hypothetical protein